MAASGTAEGAILAGQEEGGIVAVTEPDAAEQEGAGQATDALEKASAIEMSECGIQVGDLDEYAEYFECFLKIGDCLPKIIVCGTDEEMPRIVVCEGLKRRPPVNATEETKQVLLEIQTRVAEMINAVQINTILREEINHIEGECPVLQLKQVMKRINETVGGSSEEPEVCYMNPKRVSCKQLADNYSAFTTQSTKHNNSLRSLQSCENSKSKVSVADTFQVTCSMCVKHTQQTFGGCYCQDCAGFCQQQSSSLQSLPKTKGSDIITDEDVKALIDKCLGPPCNICIADKYDTIVSDLDIEEFNFTNTAEKIYDIIVPPGYKDQKGWGGDHKIEDSFFPPQQDLGSTEKYAETVQELKGELSKLDQLEDVLTSGEGACASASCLNAANYLNSQIAQIEEDLDILRISLERSRKERKVLEAQQGVFSCLRPVCYH